MTCCSAGRTTSQGPSTQKARGSREALKSAGEDPSPFMLLRPGKRQRSRFSRGFRSTLRRSRPNPPATGSASRLGGRAGAAVATSASGASWGLIVNDVVKDSPAAKAEIQLNDILFKLDGKPMTDQSKLIQAVQTKGDGPSRSILFARGRRR